MVFQKLNKYLNKEEVDGGGARKSRLSGLLLRTSAIVLTFFLVLPFLSSAFGEELKADLPNLRQAPSAVEKMVGEDYSYNISFLWFDRLAEGKLTFSRGEEPNTYRAVLEARTLGVTAWLTRDRIQRYVSEMEAGPDGRLHSLSHESHIIKRKGDEIRDTTNLYTFDFRNRTVRFRKSKKGKFYKDALLPMAEGDAPNDILTAFYNFRAGFFGPLQEGKRYVIPTFDRDGKEKIIVETLTSKERRKDRSLEKYFPSDGLLCRVTLDKEKFDTGEGVLYVWFDKYDRPTRGIVKDVIGLGDVRGRLNK